MTGARPPWGRTVAGNRWDALDGLRPDRPPHVGVVVVHCDQHRELDRTLAALARQTHPADRLDVVVVDDGSRTAPRVPPGVALLRQEDRGFRAAAARNRGARHVAGDVLCFLDADTAPEPDYVARLTRLPALAPEAVTVGRRRHAELSRLPHDAPRADVLAAELPAPAWLQDGYARSRDLLDADDRSYRYVISAVLACSRWFFERVGPFDESFGAYGGEDWEWAHRAWLTGAVLAHVPDAVAWHDGPDWSGRDVDVAGRQAAKNREVLRLADLVPVPGSRGRGVRPVRCDVLVRLDEAASPGAAYLCVDTVLAELPEAVVLVPEALESLFAADPRVLGHGAASDPRLAWARLVVDVPHPVRAESGALRAAVDRIGAEQLGALELAGDAGATLLRLTARRATARAAHWGTREHFPVLREWASGLARIEGEPDLEAHAGGWD